MDPMQTPTQPGLQSPTLPSAPSLPEIKSPTLRTFRELLHQSGYAGSDAAEENPSLKILKRLFSRGETVNKEEVEEGIDVALWKALVESGLLEEQDGFIRACFQIQSEAGMFFLSDFMSRDHPADLVLPIGPSGRHLACVTIRKKIRSALDLGCGCGIQALLAARHTDLVTATDINPRALALTKLNTQLNGMTNIEFLEGSHFEPVTGRKFDLIVANLPYVISPQKKYIYRDPELPGDESVRSMLHATPQYLNEDGFAHVMISWINKEGEPWWALSKEMLQSGHTDSWLNHNGSKSALEYAAMFVSTDAKKDPETHAAEKQEWAGWYRSQGFHQFELGLMTLRKRSTGKNWSTAIEIKKFLSNAMGEELNQLFENQDDLGGRLDLLKTRLIVRNLEIEPHKQMACTKNGFLFQTKISANTIKVLNELKKGITLRDSIKRAVGRKSSSYQQQVVEEITQLLNFGMLKLDKS
jgi:SAM-dependent methyltransferase